MTDYISQYQSDFIEYEHYKKVAQRYHIVTKSELLLNFLKLEIFTESRIAWMSAWLIVQINSSVPITDPDLKLDLCDKNNLQIN